MTELSFYDAPLADLQAWPDWPSDPHVIIIPGGAGHDREITVTFGLNYDWENHIPDYLTYLVRQLLPESWRVDDRGTRLELHPSGRFAGGFCEDDIATVERVVRELGLEPEVRRFA